MTSKRTSVKDRYPEAHRERTAETSGTSRQVLSRLVVALLGVALPAAIACAQGEPSEPKTRAEESRAQQKPSELETTQDYNRRLDELRQILAPHLPASGTEDHIGAEDLVEVTVFEAPEMNRVARVSSRGEISVPLLGAVHCAGLAPHELEIVLEELLRRSYILDPHVSVFVREMQSHSVSVFGAVKKPGVFQVRGAKTLVEVLSLAEGLAEDAGDTVLVMRGAGTTAGSAPGAASRSGESSDSAGSASSPGPTDAVAGAEPEKHPATVEVNLKRLLASGDATWNVPVYPGDVIKVTRAGVVYVAGEVKKPGGYLLKSNENISVLQALALAEGLTHTSQKSRARIIRTEEATGKRTEITIDLGKILAGKAQDPILQPKDIVFVPNSAARSGFYRASEAAVTTLSNLIVFRR